MKYQGLQFALWVRKEKYLGKLCKRNIDFLSLNCGLKIGLARKYKQEILQADTMIRENYDESVLEVIDNAELHEKEEGEGPIDIW